MKLNEEIQAHMAEEIAALQALLRIRSVENRGENGNHRAHHLDARRKT